LKLGDYRDVVSMLASSFVRHFGRGEVSGCALGEELTVLRWRALKDIEGVEFQERLRRLRREVAAWEGSPAQWVAIAADTELMTKRTAIAAAPSEMPAAGQAVIIVADRAASSAWNRWLDEENLGPLRASMEDI
jgi:hypothetical protein